MPRRLTVSDPDLGVDPTYIHVPTRRDLTILLAMTGDRPAAIEADRSRKGKLRYTDPVIYRGGGAGRYLPLPVFRSLLRRGWIEPYFHGMVIVRFQLSRTGAALLALLRDME